jgi:transglutaminase-like putative cysteine protease
MTLTHFERLKVDPRPVLRVRINTPDQRPVPPEQTLYLRGAVLDTYEDGRWRARFERQERRDADDGAVDGWTTLDRVPPPGRAVIRQHIRATPLAGDLSFCLPDPVRVGWREARYDPAGILFFPAPPRELAEYDVESALMPMDVPRVSRPEPAPPRYLQLPPGLESLRELARKQEAREGRIHAKVAGFVRFLMRNGFTYRLGPFVPAEGKDPVEHFLEKREGYCVHYATALALLCRASGVPTRIATGFQLADPQEDGTFLVKNSDAHAWVEVWFGPEHGWRAYDATPPESRPPGAPPGGDPVATVEKKKQESAAQGLRPRWDRFIVDFDPALQGKTARETLRAVAGAASAAVRFLVSPLTVGTLAALAALAFGAYLLLPPRQRNRLRQIATGFREPTTVDFYRDFLWTLSRRGLRKAPWLTALEFASQARLRFDDPGIDFVTDRFCRTRYRGTPPTPEERRKIDEIIERLRVARAPEAGK